MRVALAQLNPVVGDVVGNLGRLVETVERLQTEKPDLVVFPELFLTGYPPRDLLELEWFVDRVEAAVARVATLSARFPATGILVGAPVRTGAATGAGLYNAALLFADGRELGRVPKTLLPTYDVFDELRHFDPAVGVEPLRFQDELLGVTVCEDAWNGPEQPGRRRHAVDPVARLAEADATLLVNVSASPFTVGKESTRFRFLSGHARRLGLPLVFVNQVGANDELVFDGRSLVLDRSGRQVLVLAGFEEQVAVVDTGAAGQAGDYSAEEPIATVHAALVLGIRDYVRKCGFRQAVVGLSGGIDSAVVACLGVDALGSENVLGVTMPSEYSSRGSVEDSAELARSLGIRLERVPIQAPFASYREMLGPVLPGEGPDETEENIQARIRGNVLMALSNRSGALVLSTGNKSELAVGYCTLYGDMSGGLAVLADVPKTMVYELARYINSQRRRIPDATISKPPSAELKPGQADQDTLPPYEVLDDILARWVDDGESVDDIIRAGHDRDVVHWVVRAVVRNEYKRRQAAPGIKVTGKAFGTGRRFPIATRYLQD